MIESRTRRGLLLAGLAVPALLGSAGCAPLAVPGGEGPAPEWRPGTLRLDPAPDEAVESALPAATGADPYGPLANALRAVQRPGGTQRARVMLIGDSHTAGPFLVERLRELFQARFGSAGIGRLPPGRAQRFFNPSHLRVEQSGDWVAQNALRSSSPGPFGLTGYRLTGEAAGSSLTLRLTGEEGFDRIHLALLAGPDSGGFRLRVDEQADAVRHLRQATPGFHRLVAEAGRNRRELALELLGDGRVELLGWGVERRSRGVLVEGFGINGATLATLDNRDQEILARELAAMPPALLILEFGTNEATDTRFDEPAYAASLTRWVRRLRATLPRSGLLLMAPPDAGRPARRRTPGGCAGVTPLPALQRIQSIQRQVAAAERIGIFDWSAEVTHTPCRLPALAQAHPPLMQRDLVHLSAEGYRLTAERLYRHILHHCRLAEPAI